MTALLPLATLTKPPMPTALPLNRLTLTFPCLSAWARPRKGMSMPRPSYQSNIAWCSMNASALDEVPKSRPEPGQPPIAPTSVVSVNSAVTSSWAATLPIPSGMPYPRLTTAPGISSMAARLHMTSRSFHRKRRDTSQRGLEVTGQDRAELLTSGLEMVFRRGDHHVVHEGGWDTDVLGVQGARQSEILHLGDDDPAAVLGGLGKRKLLKKERFLVHRDVAPLISGRAPDQRDVDRKRLVEEVLSAAKLDELDIVGSRRRVHLGSPQPGVKKGPEADRRDDAGAVGRDLPVELDHHALRDAIGFAPVLLNQVRHIGCHARVAADPLCDEPFVAEVVDPGEVFRGDRRYSVADAGALHQREATRMALAEE